MPSVNYDIDRSLFQSSEESCWYAAYGMIYTWKGKPISSIKERIEKAGLDYKDFWNNGLPVEKYHLTMAALGLSGWRRGYIATLIDDLDFFGQTLKNYGPLWCAWSSPSEHAVVISGIDVDKKRIIVTNPNSDNSGSAQLHKMDQEEFRKRLGSKEQRAAVQGFNG